MTHIAVKLTIKRADDSIYWVEHFNSVTEQERWLAEEMTRPYWDPTYTTEVEVTETEVILL